MKYCRMLSCWRRSWQYGLHLRSAESQAEKTSYKQQSATSSDGKKVQQIRGFQSSEHMLPCRHQSSCCLASLTRSFWILGSCRQEPFSIEQKLYRNLWLQRACQKPSSKWNQRDVYLEFHIILITAICESFWILYPLPTLASTVPEGSISLNKMSCLIFSFLNFCNFLESCGMQ